MTRGPILKGDAFFFFFKGGDIAFNKRSQTSVKGVERGLKNNRDDKGGLLTMNPVTDLLCAAIRTMFVMIMILITITVLPRLTLAAALNHLL